MIRRKRFEFLLEAMSPIAHHSGTVGNHAHLMTSRMRTARGWEDVPIITGDTMRHKMRSAAAWATLDAAGLSGGLTEDALRLLFNGGMIHGSSGGAVNMRALDALTDLVPAIGLFGGCAQNQLVPGRLTVEPAILICCESERYCQAWAVRAAAEMFALDSFTAHVDEEQRVRMDETSNPVAHELLLPAARANVSSRMLARERASTTDDAIAKEATKGSMMPRTAEVLAPGSLFSWACEAVLRSDLDEDVFHVALVAFLARITVGGRIGTGHGTLRVAQANQINIGTPAREFEPFDTAALTPRAGQLFRAHVAERKERVREFLDKVAA